VARPRLGVGAERREVHAALLERELGHAAQRAGERVERHVAGLRRRGGLHRLRGWLPSEHALAPSDGDGRA
jgi:hypothetical protein